MTAAVRGCPRLLWMSAALFLAFACSKAAPPPEDHPLAPRPPSDADERENLLNFAHGASVVSRTGELMLDSSALLAIDGDPSSAWLSPPGDPLQTLVFSLPAPARITRLGVRLSDKPHLSPKRIRFALSADGETFTVVAGMTPKATREAQFADIAPVEASYVRVEITEAEGRYVSLVSVHARGEFLRRPEAGSIDGCWTINGSGAEFASEGARETGTFASGTPVHLEGGSDGRFHRFVWIRGNEFGTAAISVTPEGDRLAGLTWHEEPIPLFFGNAWYGERRPCAARTAAPADVARPYLARAGRLPLYGLRFDEEERLSEQESEATLAMVDGIVRAQPRQFRFIGWEFRFDAEKNRESARRRLASLRDALSRRGLALPAERFVTRGSDEPRQTPQTDAQRALYGVIELEAVR
ncbi:MAG TPA: discoidin domain-containing protein [Thermoanaerobaculia bacterium]|nr:discoidin domain-containing protein [Thermoanaerobaculia bacterium]